MSCLKRFVGEELRAGDIYHRLSCGHSRRALFAAGDGAEGIPRTWQHCPECYQVRRAQRRALQAHAAGVRALLDARPPVSLIRVTPEDAHWLAGLLGALILRGELEYPDAARRVAVAARFAADNPTKEVTRG